MKKLTMILLMASLVAVGCGDEEENNATTNNTANNVSTNNATTNNATTNNATTNNATTNNATTNNATTNNATTGTCAEGEAFDTPLDTCVTCPNKAYDCDLTVAQVAYDFDTSIFTFTPADGDASFTAVTLGGQRPGDPQNPGEEFTVEGTQDGRTWTFDVSAEETSTNVQINNLTFTDSCGDEFDITFVFNYTPGDAGASQDPFCPLGG